MDNYINQHIFNSEIMNKTDLVNEVAAKAQLNKTDAKAAVDAVLESIAQALANEDKVQLIGFGTFAIQEKEARTGINPRTKEKIEIPARKVVKFKPADGLGK
ncbi:MAG: HU family DNA-binding protein [Bacteroides sp.]|nr:HU family DNA-binding protein [Bacteroides sp.]